MAALAVLVVGVLVAVVVTEVVATVVTVVVAAVVLPAARRGIWIAVVGAPVEVL